MKRFFAFIIFIILLFCGCAENKNKNVDFTDISFCAAVEIDGKEYVFNAEINKDGVLTATVLKPETIKGMYFTAENGAVNICFMGVEITKSSDDIPSLSAVNMLYGVIKDTMSSGTVTENKIEGEISGQKYSLTISDDGTPEELTVPNADLKITFSDVYYKNR